MRTKCSGGERCSKCIKDDAVCIYGDRKRERNKKCDQTHAFQVFGVLIECRDLVESLERITTLEEENQALVNALRSVTASPGFDTNEHSEVMQILQKVSMARNSSDA